VQLCSVEEFSKAMRFYVVSDVEILSGTLQVSFPTSSVKSRGSRLLQSSGFGAFRIDNIRLPGSGSTNNDKTAYRAFTAINAIRFFGTIFLVFSTLPMLFGRLISSVGSNYGHFCLENLYPILIGF
jgi:hypothetical protein